MTAVATWIFYILFSVLAEARAAKKQGIHFIAVGVGSSIDVQELNGIANFPSSDNVILIPNEDTLLNRTESLKHIIRNSK